MTSRDNQEFLNIDVLQGITKSRKECFKVATTKIEGLPPGEKGSQKITVVYEVDKNGVLTVSAFSTNKGTNAKTELTMNTMKLTLPQEEV